MNTLLIWIHITRDVSQKLPDDDPSGSKHVAETQNNEPMLIQ
jgi:hypothetical protein